MDVTILTVKTKFALVYFDDIWIFSGSAAEHSNQAKDVVKLLRDAGVTLKLTGCNFLTKTVE